jgi:hypothetical protein
MAVIEGAVRRNGVTTSANVQADGSSLGPFTHAGTPTTQLNNIADKGALCIDTTNGKLLINTGTLASNTWTVVGTQT